ncbi:MAG: DMT family transporter [Alphaproteobacteria bacterium]|nr:DMT family transporter [Alphaproteobacteria bacterium]
MAVPREPPIVVPMRLWLLGPLGVATFNLCFTFGVLYAGSVGAAVAASISPLVAVFVLWLGFRVQPGRGIAVAVALAVVGGLIAALGNPVARQGGVHGLGEAIMILGSAVWTWYSHLAQSWLRGWSQLRIAAITLIPAALFLLILYVGAVVGGALAFPPATPSYWQLAMLAYLAMFPTFTGIMAWNYGVKNLGVTVATLYLNFIPVVAVVIAAIAGTWPNWEQLLGGAMMLVGVIHAQRKRADVRD